MYIDKVNNLVRVELTLILHGGMRPLFVLVQQAQYVPLNVSSTW